MSSANTSRLVQQASGENTSSALSPLFKKKEMGDIMLIVEIPVVGGTSRRGGISDLEGCIKTSMLFSYFQPKGSAH